MELINRVTAWIVERADTILRWVGGWVMPAWNGLARDHDELLFLGMILLPLAAVVCVFVTIHRIRERNTAERERRLMKAKAAAAADPSAASAAPLRSGTRKSVRRRKRRRRKARDGSEGSDWGYYYALICKCYYYPMLAYFFMLFSPFYAGRVVPPEETFFFTFPELSGGFQVVAIFLMLRFAAVVLSDLVRFRFVKLLKFLLYTAACVVVGTFIGQLLEGLAQAGDGNLLIALVSVIVSFLFWTIPLVYFWISMLLPLYMVVMPLLAPFALIAGIIETMQSDEQDFVEWLRESQFFVWLWFFVDA